MANNDLLKEAIADAKAVKETAIANAKLALEEAFTPHLKSMLSAKLEEMDKDDEDIDDSITNEEDIYEGDEEANEELDEINLDELLAELELDENARTDAEEEGYLDGMKDEKEDLKEDERTDAEEEGYLDGMEDEKEDEEDKIDDEEIDLEDMSEDDLKGFIEAVIKDLVADGTIEAGKDFGEEDVEDEVEVEDDVEVDVEIDEAVDGEKGIGNEDGDKDDSKVEKETEKMRFKEALDEIEALKVELQEVNLLNAKLLYTNKVFKSKNLTEDKKVKVLKAFDKASTVKEAKVIFDTLNEGLVSKSEAIVRPKGSASKATGTITEAKKPIIESNDVYNRMRKLAGLI